MRAEGRSADHGGQADQGGSITAGTDRFKQRRATAHSSVRSGSRAPTNLITAAGLPPCRQA
jgi:hypothetical protein